MSRLANIFRHPGESRGPPAFRLTASIDNTTLAKAFDAGVVQLPIDVLQTQPLAEP